MAAIVSGLDIDAIATMIVQRMNEEGIDTIVTSTVSEGEPVKLVETARGLEYQVGPRNVVGPNPGLYGIRTQTEIDKVVGAVADGLKNHGLNDYLVITPAKKDKVLFYKNPSKPGFM